MRDHQENTPPRQDDIEAEDADLEIVFIDEMPPPADEDLDQENEDAMDEFEEVTDEQLDAILGGGYLGNDESVLTFDKHKSPVFSCSIHPSKDWACTGGEDDMGYIWNTSTGEVIHEINGHKDTVISCGFNYDGSYLASGDIAGEIQVFKLADGIRKVWEYSMGDMCWMKWHPSANVLMAGAESGEIYIWRIPSGDCKILPGQGQKCEAAELTGDGKKIFAGYGDGSLRLWDIKSSTVISEVTSTHPLAHTDNVSSVSCDPENPFYMSGSEDSKILFVSNNGPVGSVETAGPVECVSFCTNPDYKVAASGTLHGQIAIWDHAKQTLRITCEHNEADDGITLLKWLPENTLLAGTIQGNLLAFDDRSGQLKFKLEGHAADIYSAQYDPRQQILLTVSEDTTAKIFRLPVGEV